MLFQFPCSVSALISNFTMISFSHYITLSVLLLAEIPVVSSFSATCHQVLCPDIQLTPQHSAQISVNRRLGITVSECLSHFKMFTLEEFFVVYCPDESFCGLDIEATSSKEMRQFANKSCSVYAKNSEQCIRLNDALTKAG